MGGGLEQHESSTHAPGHGQAGQPEFEKFRDTYESELGRALAFTGQEAEVFTAAKADVLLDVVNAHLGDPLTIDALDVGCGTGATDSHLLGRFRSISGADVSAGMIERARETNPS